MSQMKTVLITGAGAGGSNNLIRGIRHGDYPVRIVGSNADRFALAQSLANENYLLPHARAGAAYIDAVRHVIAAEKVDLVIPSNDIETAVLSAHREELATEFFLPAAKTVDLCQDKFKFSCHMKEHGFPVAETYLLDDLDHVEKIFGCLGHPDKLWCRMRHGTGSKGVLPVNRPEQVRFWVQYWQEMRGVEPGSFTLSEFLPGRDFAFQSLWRDGELIIAKTCERLEYVFGENMPAGTSSSPRVGQLVNNPRVNDVCYRAVRSVDAHATGMFCVDLKENQDGDPCITEINIGRFFMISIVFNTTGQYNMAEFYLRTVFGESVNVPEAARYGDIGKAETFLIRELDNEPTVVTREDLEACFTRLAE